MKLICLIKQHDFGEKPYGWCRCKYCGIDKWIDPPLWQEFIKGKASFEDMRYETIKMLKNRN